MRDDSTIIRDRQCGIRRELDRRGVLLKIVAQDSDIPYATLLSYFPQEGGKQPAVIPMSAVYALAAGRAIPTDLLSELLPAGFAVVEVPEEMDLDKLAEHFTDFLHEKNAAHHPESECGRDIGPGERGKLESKVVSLPIKGKVA
jgi:hypothetical protein